MFNVALQHLDLGVELNCLSIVCLLGLANSANSSAQYSSEGGGIKGRNVPEEGIQRVGGNGD